MILGIYYSQKLLKFNFNVTVRRRVEGVSAR